TTAAVMLVTFMVTVAVGRLVPHFQADFFYPALALVAWFLGADAAVFGLALALAAEAWLTPETPFPSLDDVLYLALFVLTAGTVLRLSNAQRRARELSEDRAREASEANEAKDRFLGLVSHDLRGPLQGIRLWLSILRADRFN